MFCPNCGNEVNEGAVFCPNCGSQIGNSSEVKPEASGTAKDDVPGTKKQPKKEKKKGRKKIIALLVVVAIIVVAIVSFMSSSGGDETAEKAAEFSEEVQNGYLGNYDTVTVVARQTVVGAKRELFSAVSQPDRSSESGRRAFWAA